MRGTALLLATLACAPLASAAVITFDGIGNATFEGSTTDRDANDLTVAGGDGTVFGFRSYNGTNSNDATVIENGKIIVNNWNGKLFMRPTESGVLFSLTSVDALRRWGENADFEATGIKADDSLVTQTFSVNSELTCSFVDFDNLKEVKFDFAGGANASYAFFDNITYAVPEPGSLGLLIVSAGAILFRHRKA